MAQMVQRPARAAGAADKSSCAELSAGLVIMLPVGYCSVELAIDGKIGALIGILSGQRLIQVDTQPRSVAGKHHAVFEGVIVREYGVGLFGMRHVLLDAEVMDRRAEVQRGGHGDGGQIRSAVTAGAHMVKGSKVRDFLEMSQPAGMGNGHADVVNPLVADQVVRIPDGVEDFADSDGRCGVLANDLETLLQLRRGGVFKPEEMKWLQFPAQAAGLKGSKPMVAVVEQVQVIAEGFSDLLE